MKRLLCAVSVFSLGALLLSGCGRKEEPTTPPAPPEAPKVQTPPATPTPPSAVQPAVTDIKADIEKALALAKEGKYTEALAMLQKLSQTNLSADQKKSLDDVIAQIQKMATDAAAKASAEKAGGDLQKSIPGLPR